MLDRQVRLRIVNEQVCCEIFSLTFQHSLAMGPLVFSGLFLF